MTEENLIDWKLKTVTQIDTELAMKAIRAMIKTVITDYNWSTYNIPLLHARMIVAHSKGKFLVIDGNGELSVADEKQKEIWTEAPILRDSIYDSIYMVGDGASEPQGIINYPATVAPTMILPEENAPRNRRERRRGRQKQSPIWKTKIEQWRKT